MLQPQTDSLRDCRILIDKAVNASNRMRSLATSRHDSQGTPTSSPDRLTISSTSVSPSPTSPTSKTGQETGAEAPAPAPAPAQIGSNSGSRKSSLNAVVTPITPLSGTDDESAIPGISPSQDKDKGKGGAQGYPRATYGSPNADADGIDGEEGEEEDGFVTADEDPEPEYDYEYGRSPSLIGNDTGGTGGVNMDSDPTLVPSEGNQEQGKDSSPSKTASGLKGLMGRLKI